MEYEDRTPLTFVPLGFILGGPVGLAPVMLRESPLIGADWMDRLDCKRLSCLDHECSSTLQPEDHEEDFRDLGIQNPTGPILRG